MRATLQKLDDWLSAHRPALAGSLRPGLDHEQLAAVGEALGTGLSAPLRLLWQRHDGQESRGGAFVHNLSLMPTAEVVYIATLHQEMFRDEPQWWGPRWVPILSNGGGDFLCVDLGGDTPRGQLVSFWHDSGTREVVAPSLEAWLEALMASWARCPWETRDGAFSLPLSDDRQGWDAHRAVMREMMPGYPVYYTVRMPR